jgi:hypothetical protein
MLIDEKILFLLTLLCSNSNWRPWSTLVSKRKKIGSCESRDRTLPGYSIGSSFFNEAWREVSNLLPSVEVEQDDHRRREDDERRHRDHQQRANHLVLAGERVQEAWRANVIKILELLRLVRHIIEGGKLNVGGQKEKKECWKSSMWVGHDFFFGGGARFGLLQA